MARFVLLLLLGVIGVVYITVNGERAKSDAVGTWRKILAGGSPGCSEIERLDKLHEYLEQGDPVAYQRGLGEATASGDCIVYTDGQEVYVTNAFKSKVKLRLKGDTSEYWASYLVLQQPAK